MVRTASDGLHENRMSIEEFAYDVLLCEHGHGAIVRCLVHLPPVLRVPIQVFREGLVCVRRVEGIRWSNDHDIYDVCDATA